jgi:hypothetical protein
MRTQKANLLLLILLISVCYMTAPAVTKAQELPPPTREYFPNKWDEFTSAQGRFRIRFPGKPREEFSPVGVNFLSYSGLLEYRVSYVDEPELTDDPGSAKRYLQETKSATLELTKISGERIIRERAVTVDGHLGYFVHVESATGWVRSQEIVVGRRVYTIIVEGRKGQAHGLVGKNDFERVALGFINSFKLIPLMAKPNTSLDRRGGSGFCKLIGPAKVA